MRPSPKLPALFDKHLHTGAESIAGRAAARGDDPATIDQSVTAYRSGIQRRALQNVIDGDPVAAANRYRAIRDGLTAADQQTAQKELFEPLARALAARDVDGLLPPVEMEGPAPLSPEQRASVAEAIEAQPWTDARKRYAREDLATRGSLEDRQRKQAADAAKDKGLAIAEQLGPDFTSITQLPPEIRRDLDDDTMQTLGLQAQDNLDGRQVAPNGEASLMMNLIASQNPAAFAKEDLRLVQGKVTPQEYRKLVGIQNTADGTARAINRQAYRRVSDTLFQIGTGSVGDDNVGTGVITPRLAQISQDETSAKPDVGGRRRAATALVPERPRPGASAQPHRSRNDPRGSRLQPSRDRDLATEPTAIPPDRKIRRIFRGIPRGSVTLQAPDGAAFLAPANADFKAAYRSAAGHWNSWTAKAPIKAAVGHWGAYDFQRRGDIFIPRYTDASNYAVGVVMAGAGYTLEETFGIAGGFAAFNSSNAGSARQRLWWKRGWIAAMRGAYK